MRIALLTAAQLPGVAALEALCFHAPWPASALAMLCGEQGFGLAALENDTVVGYVGLVTVLDEGQFTNVAVHPDHRRCGIADALMEALLAEAAGRGIRYLSLEVRQSNAPAIALYRKHGFAVAGKREGFYANPREAALVMTREI